MGGPFFSRGQTGPLGAVGGKPRTNAASAVIGSFLCVMCTAVLYRYSFAMLKQIRTLGDSLPAQSGRKGRGRGARIIHLP